MKSQILYVLFILYRVLVGGGAGVWGCGLASLVVGLSGVGAAVGGGGLCRRACGRAWCVGSGVGLGWAGVRPSQGVGFLAI
jgi:hypothetical protein